MTVMQKYKYPKIFSSKTHQIPLIEFVYPYILDHFNDENFFHQRAILAPKNDVVQEINDRLLSVFPEEEKQYLSSDSICPTEMVNENLDDSLCSPNILNGIKASGLPNHRLVLKVGVPVMLLRNIDQKSGLCNGTRLKAVYLGQRVIQVEIISGSHIGDRHYIPRITLIPRGKKNFTLRYKEDNPRLRYLLQ
ncbi:uncharacterized protein LOC110933540 [Helianthus annuus]|uniref:uncharacterized protein LOC110933540 n=1 Tax=Helianthus annuus TaxID=4232 RepID=UPI000B90A241|nr:uncharacterized protein LOC110933540 [Helianthus annuus]